MLLMNQLLPQLWVLLAVLGSTITGCGASEQSGGIPSYDIGEVTEGEENWIIPRKDFFTLHRILLVPEHKFMFCYIEKNACSSFNRLLNSIVGKDSTHINNIYGALTPDKFNMTEDHVDSILRNKSWYKAVFYRNPVDR